jgi:hypothetical protein
MLLEAWIGRTWAAIGRRERARNARQTRCEARRNLPMLSRCANCACTSLDTV